MIFIQHLLVALSASVLDRILGDPEKWPHPVRWFGSLISLADKILNKGSALWRLLSGSLFALSLTAGVYFGAYYLFAWLQTKLPIEIYWALLIFVANQCVSFKDLKHEAMVIYSYLKSDNLVEAQKRLKRIVGRDTDKLPPESVTTATIESVAESTPDGILSPLFYMCLGGVPAALAMKVVNTMDSMIGHRDDDYEYFGKTAARLDDLLGYIPARVSVLLFTVASWLCRERGVAAFQLALKTGHDHASVNAGYSEASMAGSLGIRLGGKVSYDGEPYDRPVFDGGDDKITEDHIVRALRLSSWSQWLFLLFMAVVAVVLTWAV